MNRAPKKTPKTNAGRWCPWLQFATYPQSPSSGPVRCCDVTDLYQAFSQRTGPGRLWISLSALFVAGFGYLPNPKINTRYFTQANNLKTCNLQTPGVTHVLNQKCYLCSDCARILYSDFCILLYYSSTDSMGRSGQRLCSANHAGLKSFD